MAGDQPLLKIEDLRVATAAGGLPILLGVDLTVRRGEVLGLVGESGCGKSVTGLSILRLLPAGLRLAGGRVLLDGVDLLALAVPDMIARRGRRIGWIPQDPTATLNPTHTIGTHLVDTLMRHRALSRRAARVAAVDLLRDVGLPNPKDQLAAYPHQLSGGMAQRAAIARAIAGGPDLLIADEPTTALDVTTQTQILDLLLALRDDRGLGLILITHDLGVVAETADRVAVMYCGRVVETAPVAALFAGAAHPYAAALLDSVPSLEDDHPLAAIPGSVPPMDRLPAGCAFHPRCARAIPACRQDVPRLERHPHTGLVACHAPRHAAPAGAAA